MENETAFDYYVKICKSIEGLQYTFIEMKIDVADLKQMKTDVEDIKEMLTKLSTYKPIKRKKEY